MRYIAIGMGVLGGLTMLGATLYGVWVSGFPLALKVFTTGFVILLGGAFSDPNPEVGE